MNGQDTILQLGVISEYAISHGPMNVRRFWRYLAIVVILTIFGQWIGSSALAAPQIGDASLSALYERLGKSQTSGEALQIEAAISRNWLRSGSATADLLLKRAHIALRVEDPALAIEIIDRAIALSPNWAEAYVLRGKVFATLGNDDRAVADLKQALIRDDHHFVALQILARLFEQAGMNQGALKLYERALAINPHLKGVTQTLEKLHITVDGRPL